MATAVHDDHLQLCSQAGSTGWNSYWEMRRVVAELDIPLPSLPLEPSRNSLGGLGPALSALVGSLISAKAQLNAQLEEKRREAGFTCALNALGLAKCKEPNLDVASLGDEEPDGEAMQQAMAASFNTAERIIADYLASLESDSSDEE